MHSTQEGEEIEKGSSKEKSLGEDLVETYANYIEAIEKGNIEEVERLLQKEPLLLNQLTSKGFTPLMMAILKDQEEIVRCLLAKGASLSPGNTVYQDAEEFTRFYGREELAKLIHKVKLSSFSKSVGKEELKPPSTSPKASFLETFWLEQTIHSPVLHQDNWELDVPHDHSCLFWAVTFGYLWPVGEDFETRFIKLFGEEELEKAQSIKRLLKDYNPFAAVDIFSSEELNRLVREQFRRRAIEYIAEHQEAFKEHWVENSLEATFKDYLSRMHHPNCWGGELEIRAMSQLLGCTIKVIGAGYSVEFLSGSMSIGLVHVNAENQEEARNHYHFTVEKEIGYRYQQSCMVQEGQFSLESKPGIQPEVKCFEKKTVLTPNNNTIAALLKKYNTDDLEYALKRAAKEQEWKDLDQLLQHWGSLNSKEEIITFLLKKSASYLEDIEQGLFLELLNIEFNTQDSPYNTHVKSSKEYRKLWIKRQYLEALENGFLKKNDIVEIIQKRKERGSTKLIQIRLQQANLHYEENRLDDTIREYEALAMLTPLLGQESIFQQIYHNLGCLYHIRGIQNNCLQEFEQADNTFKKGLALYQNAAICCEYGQFLYQRGLATQRSESIEKAINWLRKSISLSTDKDNNLEFGALEEQTVPPILRQYIKKDQRVTIEPALLASYLLIRCHLLLEQIDDAHQAFNSFEKICSLTQIGNALLVDIQSALLQLVAKDKDDANDTVGVSTTIAIKPVSQSVNNFSMERYHSEIQTQSNSVLNFNVTNLTRGYPQERKISLPTDNKSIMFKKYKTDNLEDALRKAIVERNRSDVEELTQLGADINSQAGHSQETALHQAIEKKEMNIIRFLLEKGARIDLKDNQDKTIENYAKERDLDLKLLIYEIYLKEAYLNEQYERQCTIMFQLSNHYLKQQNYHAAAKLLNGALAIAREHVADIGIIATLEAELLAQLKEVEPLFVKEILQINYKASVENYGINPEYKLLLLKLRNEVKKRLEELGKFSELPDEKTSGKIQHLFKWITEEINKLIQKIVEDCLHLMSEEPPCDYALIGTGSLAREEMTPYSDLECFLLISEDSDENKNYFKNLSDLFELKIINLGETDLVKGQTLLPLDMQNPMCKGFSLDIHKKPNNKNYALIGTVEQIARYQLPENYVHEPSNHLSSALASVIYITGNSKGKSLLNNYCETLNKIYRTIVTKTQCPLALERALFLMKEDIIHFVPKLKREDEGRLFQVKEDLYRLPQIIIDSLSLYIGLYVGSTWNRINELCKQKFILLEGGQRLKSVLSMAIWLRLKTYSYYNKQQETIDSLLRVTDINDADSSQRYYGLGKQDFILLTEMLKTLIPFYQCADHFYHTKGKENQFGNCILYDNSDLTVGIIALRLCQYRQAIELFECELEQTKQGNTKLSLSELLNNLGLAWKDLGYADKAIEYYEQALAIDTKLYGPEHSNIAVRLSNLGEVLYMTGNSQEAIKCYEWAYEIDIKTYYVEHPKVAIRLSSLGELWRTLGNTSKAIKLQEQALAIWTKLHGMEHPSVATALNNLGLSYRDENNIKRAVECYERALTIDVKIYGLEHPKVAIRFNNLGEAWQVLGDNNKATKYYERAQTIWIRIYGERHPNVAIILNNLGITWSNLGNAEKAIDCYEQALEIDTKIYGSEHPNIVNSLNNLAFICQKLCNVNKAIKYYEQLLAINTKKHGSEDLVTINNVSTLALTYQKLGNAKKAIEYYEQLLELDIKKYGPEHVNLVGDLKNIAAMWQALGQDDKASEYYERAVIIASKVTGLERQEVLEKIFSNK